MMHIRHAVICVAALGFATAASAQTPWEKYLDLPTPENARKVQSASYSDSSADHDRLYEDLDLLEVQMDAGDREAVRLAFRLYSEADGHYAETLDIMLGRLVRINPTLFLEEVQYQHNAPRRRWGPPGLPPRGLDGVVSGLLGNYGFPYVDRMRAHVYETERRIAALDSVTDPDLRQLRDSCVEILQYQLHEYR
jgi:hypothetical protein